MPDPSSQPDAAATAQPETVALFISDLHLQPALPRTTQAFLDFLQNRATGTRQLYLLGDLFEYWAGDDDLATPFNRGIVDAIRRVADAGVALFWIAGNRDFLVGADFAAAAGLTLLPDPYIATFDRPPNRALRMATPTAPTISATWNFAPRCGSRPGSRRSWRCRWRSARPSSPSMRDGSRAEQRKKSAEIMDVNRLRRRRPVRPPAVPRS